MNLTTFLNSWLEANLEIGKNINIVKQTPYLAGAAAVFGHD